MTISELYSIYLQYPHVQTDTRKLVANEIFFCLTGDNFNGNTFAEKALELGAAAVIIDQADFFINEKTILVDNVLSTLQALAKHHRQNFSIPFIAITGSNGKTTTKELLLNVLSKKFITYATKGNLNNHIGVPLTILAVKQNAQMAIIEMGANHQLEIKSYCQYAMPTHVLINNCGKAHLEGFGGIEGVKKGKGELYDYAAENNCVVFRNTDLDYLQTMLSDRNFTNEVTYGSSNANYTGTIIDNAGKIDVAITSHGLEQIIHTQLVGDYNFGNIMAAFAVGKTFGIEANEIKNALEEYSPSNSRSQLVLKGSNTIILDAYNANPTSMKAAIENFARRDFGNKIVMLGGMWELGEDSILEHQQIIEQLQATNWNAVVLVGGHFKHCKHSYIFFENNLEAKQWLQNQNFSNTAILVKGSRATAMEKVIEDLV
jgi:UDP-N-acetylmuramoyl-tripeptide--D-alanyl-D-alanine ligase